MPPAKSPQRRAGKNRKRAKGTFIGKTVELEISDMAAGGAGIARHRGQQIFVPYTLPGETVTAKITEQRGAVLFARGQHLQAASADRVRPQCPHFGPGRCWGCQWQHIDYAAQLLLKQDVLADQLLRVGRLPAAHIAAVLQPVIPAAQEWAYSHRLTLHRSPSGAWGLPKRAGSESSAAIEAIGECHIAHPDLLDLLAELDLDYARARRLTLQRGSDGRMMLILALDAEDAPQLHSDLPVSVNLILPSNEPINLIGDAHSRFHIGGRDFRVTAGAYIRPNIAQIDRLIPQVLAALRLSGNERVLDLYAGVGVFSAFIAKRSQALTLVESYPPAASDAAVNLMDFNNIEVVEAPVEALLNERAASRAACDVALVDPPPRGIGKAVIQSLRRLAVKRLVYVSSSPAALARDSKALLASGFRLQSVQPIDLAPQTYYIDAVARFERAL